MIDIEKYDDMKVGLTEYNKKREVIRLHDNEKLGVKDWYGRKDYAPMSITEVEKRFMEVMIEKGQSNGQS
jgi:hypothetical protein